MEVQQQFGSQVTFVGIPGLGSSEEFAEFIADTGVGSFQHIDDPGGELWARFGVVQQRTYILINQDGTAERKGYGSLGSDVANLIAK